LGFCTFPLSDQSESSCATDEVSDAESSLSSNEFSLGTADGFKEYVDKMRAFVSEMVTNLSSIMQDLIATSDEGQSKGRLKTLIMNTKKDFANDRSSFVLLAIATIFVVLLKRA
jgi:flagellar biosynthesis/type III secretory pathway protein FliH